MERVGDVRHRRAQHEGRLHRRVLLGHSAGRPPTTTISPTASTTACRTRSRRILTSVRGRHARPDERALLCRTSGRAGRLTLQGALRYDHAWSYYPAQQIGPTRFLPTPLIFPETQGVIGYNDIDPRFGVAYDLFGNGKTALKFNVGPLSRSGGGRQRELLVAPARPRASRRPSTRTWTDANGNFTPDCDLQNGLAQDSDERRRFLRRDQQSELREERQHVVVRPEHPPGLVQPAVRLDHQRDASSTSCCRACRSRSATRGAGCSNFTVTDNRADGRGRLHAVQHHGAARSAAAGRRRLRRVRSVQRRAGQVRPDRQLPRRTRRPTGTISQMYNGIDVNVTARSEGLPAAGRRQSPGSG